MRTTCPLGAVLKPSEIRLPLKTSWFHRLLPLRLFLCLGRLSWFLPDSLHSQKSIGSSMSMDPPLTSSISTHLCCCAHTGIRRPSLNSRAGALVQTASSPQEPPNPLTFTFTLKLFSRRFYPKRHYIPLSEEGEPTIYRCRSVSTDVHRTKCQTLTIARLTHTMYCIQQRELG